VAARAARSCRVRGRRTAQDAGDVVADPVQLDRGVLHLRSSPGLGAAIDPDALKRYRASPDRAVP